MDDLRDKIRSGENALEKLVRQIPGFEGYRNREQRRDADKIQRDFLAQRLAKQKNELEDIGRDLVNAGNLAIAPEIDRIGKQYDKLADRTRHAIYGYSGFMDSIKIGEKELDQVYEHDLLLLTQVEGVSEALTALKAMAEKGQELKDKLRALETSLKEFEQGLDDREKMLQGVS